MVKKRTKFIAVGLIIVALVAILILQVPKVFDGLSGGASLLVARTDPLTGQLVLDEARTRSDAPALARMLDQATLEDRVRTSVASEVRSIQTYLDAEARRAGASEFANTNSQVEWLGSAFLIVRSEN